MQPAANKILLIDLFVEAAGVMLAAFFVDAAGLTWLTQFECFF